MADITISEILAERRNAGFPIEPGLTDVLERTPGLTEALYTNNVLDSLGGTYPWLTGRLSTDNTAGVPDIQSAISLLQDKSLKDDPGVSKKEPGAKTAIDKFIENFPKKYDVWKKKILKTPGMGKKGWDSIVELWKQASYDKMNADIRKARFNAMNGLDENGEIEHPLEWLTGKLGGVFYPRSQKALEEGRDPSAADVFMDVAQNAAYAVPVAGAEAMAARSVANPMFSKILGAATGAALAPAAVTAGDYALGTKDYAGLGDAAIDWGLGTAANLGVGKAIAPGISALVNLGEVRSRIPQSVVNFLKGPKFESTKARDLINKAQRDLNKHYGESNVQYVGNLRKGKPVNRLSDEQVMDYNDILKARDWANDPAKRADFTQRWSDIAATDDLFRYNPAKNPKAPVSNWDDQLGAVRSKKSLEDMVYEAIPYSRTGKSTYQDILAAKNPLEQYMIEGGGLPSTTVARALTNHPELISFMDQRGLKSILKDPELRADMFRTWLINKFGNDVAASRILSRYGIDPKDVRKTQDEWRKEKAVRSSVSDILGLDSLARKAGEPYSSSTVSPSSASSTTAEETVSRELPKLSDESRKYLKEIKDNPSIVIYGYKGSDEEKEAFKSWLLREGHDLLRGTAAARPTWEVQ